MPYANLYNEEIAKEVKKRNQKLIDHEKKESETPSAAAAANHYKEHVLKQEKPKDDVIEMIKYVKSASSAKAHSEPKRKPISSKGDDGGNPRKKKQSQPEPEPAKPRVKENRVDIVKRVMKERGVSMIEASKIIKAEGLY
jgi:IS5 family transposase